MCVFLGQKSRKDRFSHIQDYYVVNTVPVCWQVINTGE